MVSVNGLLNFPYIAWNQINLVFQPAEMNFYLFIDIEYIELGFLALPAIRITTLYCFGFFPVKCELALLLLSMSVTTETKPEQIEKEKQRVRSTFVYIRIETENHQWTHCIIARVSILYKAQDDHIIVSGRVFFSRQMHLIRAH